MPNLLLKLSAILLKFPPTLRSHPFDLLKQKIQILGSNFFEPIFSFRIGVTSQYLIATPIRLTHIIPNKTIINIET